MNIRLWLAITSLSLIFSSCGHFENKICKENGQIRECTQKEEKMIDGISSIIKTVYHFDSNNYHNSFESYQKKGVSRQVIFFGENHTDIIGQEETLGAINYLAVNGGTVLLEGLDRSVKESLSCALRLLYHIYANWEWEKLGRAYDPFAKLSWEKAEGLMEALLITSESYDLSNLNLNKLECGFWDDEYWLKQIINHESLSKRNEAMVEAIIENLNINEELPLIILAGQGHLPLGENVYYHVDSQISTTKVIYDFLHNHNIDFLEKIHKRTLNLGVL